jgi:hypothetical protein
MTNNYQHRWRAKEEKASRRPDPRLPELQPVMMEALWPFPEARKALRDALHVFAAKWYGGSS